MKRGRVSQAVIASSQARARLLSCVAALAVATGCASEPAAPAATAPAPAATATDPQHQGMVGAHGDHSPHKGGMVLMNGDMHYEVVFARDGAHRIWFTDPVRAELPASVATGVTMVITRPGEPEEVLKLAIDDSGESWIARGRAVTGNDAYVKITYAMQGEPHEVEIPFLIQTPTP
jgi:hypothetical protein